MKRLIIAALVVLGGVALLPGTASAKKNHSIFELIKFQMLGWPKDTTFVLAAQDSVSIAPSFTPHEIWAYSGVQNTTARPFRLRTWLDGLKMTDDEFFPVDSLGFTPSALGVPGPIRIPIRCDSAIARQTHANAIWTFWVFGD